MIQSSGTPQEFGELTFNDTDGDHPVLRVLAWYEDGRRFCNCSKPIWQWPGKGVQVIAWIYRKEDSIYSTLWCGWDTHPTYYIINGWRFEGTMMPDDEYETIRQRAVAETNELVLNLRQNANSILS